MIQAEGDAQKQPRAAFGSSFQFESKPRGCFLTLFHHSCFFANVQSQRASQDSEVILFP